MKKSKSEIDTRRDMRTKARATGKRLYACLGERRAPIVALTNCAPRYGCPAFRCERGDGWYPLNGAEFTFEIGA
jgi:hypothetical protein